MSPEEFEQIAVAEWERIPAHIKQQLQNVALIIEDEPSDETREEQGIPEDETLLGLYHGIPAIDRGSYYGVGGTLPDTIKLYREPILDEAYEMDREFREATRIVVRETLWHEIGHCLGLDEHAVREREAEGTNDFPSTAS